MSAASGGAAGAGNPDTFTCPQCTRTFPWNQARWWPPIRDRASTHESLRTCASCAQRLRREQACEAAEVVVPDSDAPDGEHHVLCCVIVTIGSIGVAGSACSLSTKRCDNVSEV